MSASACVQWPAMTSTDEPGRSAPKSDLNEFLVAMSVALHQHSIYPDDHPSVGPAVEAVVRRATELLARRSTIAFGVARRQLIIDGIATDPKQPVLRRLAERLHAHHYGAVSLTRGVQTEEIGSALRALSAEPHDTGQMGLTRAGRIPAWPHLTLHPLTFDGLALVGDAEISADGSGGPSDTLGAELWLGLARAALSVEHGSAESVPSEPSEVARAIDDHPSAEAYDQAIVGHLLQIARELKDTSGPQSEPLRQKTASLIGSLRSDTLRRLVEMGGDQAQRGEFLLDATHGMAVKSVLQIVRAAADASGQTISEGLLRMLSKLATQAEHGSTHARPLADAELREQVTRLTEDWQLADPNPERYGQVLQHLASADRTDPSETGPRRPEHAVDDPLRIVQMSLECGVFGPIVGRAIECLVETGEGTTVFELVRAHPRGAGPVITAIGTVLGQPAALRVLAAREPVDFGLLEALLPFITVDGCDALLEALTESEVRATRRGLLDLLTQMDLDLGDIIAARLEDSRWYVKRNMLVLLRRRKQMPDGLSFTEWTSHPDGRVRVEAIRAQLLTPAGRNPAVLAALNDADPRIATLGLREAMKECPPGAEHRIAELALEPEADDTLRSLAATVLGRIQKPQALSALLQLSDGGRSFLGRRRLPPQTPVLVASIRALAQQWSGHPSAVSILAVAARSSSPELRLAAQRTGS